MSATLTGAGALQVYLNGELLGTLTTSGTLTFRNDLPLNELVFRYAGNGVATLAPFERHGGTEIRIR